MKKNKTKIISVILSSAILLSLSSCRYENKTQLPDSSEISSDTSTYLSSEVSEFPSSSSELSSEESSDLSSIISQIEKQNSSKPASSKPTSSKPASSKPAASKPTSSKPASSKPASSKPESSKPESKPEESGDIKMKAVWISYLEFSAFKGSSESVFRDKVSTMFSKSKDKGLNAVIVQIRPHGDSFYDSEYYPWSKWVSGTMGVSVSYDPLKIMVEEAHAIGLEIHAWLNPYRVMNDSEFATVPSNYPTKQWYDSSNRSDYMVNISDRYWLKPGNSEVQQLIINGATEVCKKYDVDGIHLDDYFYGTDIKVYGDTKSEAQANTTAMVKGLYNAIKACNSSIQFGISPLGAYREKDSIPTSDLTYHSTDLLLWCSTKGYIDYVMPQIYWEYDHSIQPFTMTLNKWENMVNTSAVKLYIGLAPYKLNNSIVENQVEDIKQSNKATGYALYRYDHISSLNLQ